MKNFKRLCVPALALTIGVTAMGLAACGGNGNEGGGSTEQTPFIKEVVILNAPETYYLYGETFDEGDFALQEIYSDGTKKNITSGYEFIRKQKSVLVDPDNYIYEDQDVPLNDPLTSNDNEIYITYKTTCQGYNLEYNLVQPITVKDPTKADTEIFTVGDNDKIYFYGDGHIESYGIQYSSFAHTDVSVWPGFEYAGGHIRNDGYWSWNGSELVIVMENYNPNVSENPDDKYREIILTKNADGTYTFHFEWAAKGEVTNSPDENTPPVFKTYTYGGTISLSDVTRRLTSDKKYGDQDLKGKYSKQTDIK